jgi:hypothetical protein
MNSYADALALYTQRRDRGILARGIKLANNTHLKWATSTDERSRVYQAAEPYWFAIKLHDTHVLTFHADGRIVLNDGGWKTVTTKARFNEYLPSGWGVYSDRGVWYLGKQSVGSYQYDDAKAYADGITIYPSMGIESVTGIGEDPKAQHKLRKRIRAYSKAYIAAFYAGDVPAPSAGDCFGCSMLAADGSAPMGGMDHMLSHLDESYFVPSILHRAAKRFGVSQIAQHTLAAAWSPNVPDRKHALTDAVFGGIVAEQLEKAVRRHCYAECGLGV